MQTKPFFQSLIVRVGEEKALAYYLKGKSEKGLGHILYHLRRMVKNQLKVKKKYPTTQLKYPTGIIYAKTTT